jgi:hypothetical protein
MIKLAFGNLRDPDFMQSLGKVCAKPIGMEFSMKLAIIGREVKKQQELQRECHIKILKMLGTPDPVVQGRPQTYTIPDENMTKFEEEMKKMDRTEFTIKVNRMDALKMSEKIDFSPQDLMLLEPLILPFEMPTEVPVSALKPAQSAPPPAH